MNSICTERWTWVLIYIGDLLVYKIKFSMSRSDSLGVGVGEWLGRVKHLVSSLGGGELVVFDHIFPPHLLAFGALHHR